MSIAVMRRAGELVAVACAMVVVGACARLGLARDSGPDPYQLIVNNRTDFNVVVYAMPATSGPGVRIGDARSFATTVISVPRRVLRPSDVLVVRVHATGSSRSSTSWTSPAASLDSGVVAELDVRSDPRGGLSRSSFYTELSSLAHWPP